MSKRHTDHVTMLKRERVLLALMDADSAGYDEMVRRIDALERTTSEYASEWSVDQAGLRRMVAFRVGSDPDPALASAAFKRPTEKAPA